MTSRFNLLIIIVFLLIFSCGESAKKENKSSEFKLKTPTAEKIKTSNEKKSPSTTVDLDNKGIGPVGSVRLEEDINLAMAKQGGDIFKKMCTACHREGKKFIGPAPNGITERRTPEWIMNMILNPEEMVQKDPLAKALLVEFNGAPMANQNLTKEEARAVLEYFRTLKQQ